MNMNLNVLTNAIRSKLVDPVYFTDEEISGLPLGHPFVFDVECYPNFFIVGFKCAFTGKVIVFEESPRSKINTTKLNWMLWRFLLIGFNSLNYDLPLICLAINGKSTEELKLISNEIINEELRSFETEKIYKFRIPKINHIDLIEVAPLKASLKLYAGRLHCARMQDLPVEHTKYLTLDEADIVVLYNVNDLDNTILLYKELNTAIELRAEMSKTYGVDLRSKSDAQIAEAVVNAEIRKLTGLQPTKPNIKNYGALKYNVPDYISFKSQELNEALRDIAAAEFKLDNAGSPVWPVGLGTLEKSKDGKETWTLKVTHNGKVYKLGMGGLHSQEKNATHEASDDIILADNDVESFYPRIILNQGLFPSHLGDVFLKVYNGLIESRLHAKAQEAACKESGDKEGAKYWKIINGSLKIVINGLFGKLGNKYSTVYAPQLMLQVTITGQLTLLMLIEMLEDAGIECISGNTDGVVSKYNKNMHEKVRQVIKDWETITNFKTEETRYAGVYSRDVNNYIATKLNKKGEIEEVKTKGVYSEKGSAQNSVLSKNPECLIISEAVQEFIKNKTPIEEFIKKCTDIRKFVSVRTVKGGAQKDGFFLGKAVRWYYAKGEYGTINYVGSGNKVPKSDGAKPLMDLPGSFPVDINYKYYIEEAKETLFDIGYYPIPKTLPLPF